MSTCWAIIIGINQYQGFQPLMQAQNDAVGIRKYLIEDAGFAPENCILLSDLSKSTEQQAVYPDQLSINEWLQDICQGRVQNDDTLWFYFSGYGAQADNKDYLMPVDGDPAQVKQTGIALQDVIKYLNQAPTKNIMMVLDMNRSQSALAGQAIGEQVTKLARKNRIPLILSCQPNEFSHETLAVRHGLFTAALLEGLRYEGCATLSHLERYLVERVPELCDQHWRPIQNPVVALPEEHKFELLWHQREVIEPDTTPVSEAATGLVSPETEAPWEGDGLVGTEAPWESDGPGTEAPWEGGGLEADAPWFHEEPNVDDLSPEEPFLIPENPDDDFGSEGVIPDLGPGPIDNFDLDEETQEGSKESLPIGYEEIDNPDDYGTTLTEDLPDAGPKKSCFSSCLGSLAALVVTLLFVAFVLRNQPVMQNALEQLPSDWPTNAGLGSNDEDDPEPSTLDDPDADPTLDPTVDNPDAETLDNLEAELPDDFDLENLDAEDLENLDLDLENLDLENLDLENLDLDTPEIIDVDLEELGLEVDEAGVDGGAGITPDNPDAPAASPNTVTAASNTVPSSSSGEDTAALLEDARRTLRPSQASRFATAIATASKIPSGDPNYDQAQADIQRWSRVILDLAEGRAAESELQAAMDAAKLIPSEPADVYRDAQERISFWEARAKSRELIREAQAIPRMGQASTYQKGILKLQEVPSDHPIEYGDAQRLIGEWTGKMLTIARARAAQGRYSSAIEAAALIPQNTPNYDQAQAEIKRWQN
ncbi:MAG: hypothetical protein F6K11_14640 [Leptolyngbya sp. SIO3F4]|nr:hypothetical protein [Leptolyngbya sp. SIO3F4]